MTFDEILADAKTLQTENSTGGTAATKKGIAAGLMRLRRKLDRNYTIITRRFPFTQNQATYQMPENAIKFTSLAIIDGGTRTPVYYVDNEYEWDDKKQQAGTTGIPYIVHMIGHDVFEVYPAPSSTTAVGDLRYQSRARAPLYGDITTPTASVINGSQLVTMASAVSPTVVGRYIKLESTTDNSDYYRIIAIDNSNTILTVENYYDGVTASAKAIRIGYCPNLPEEYHPTLSDYANYYYFLWRKDKTQAEEYLANFMQTMQDIETDYSSATTSQVIQSRHVRGGRDFMGTIDFNQGRTL